MRANVKRSMAGVMSFALLLTAPMVPEVANAAKSAKLDKAKTTLQVKETVKLTVKNVTVKNAAKIKWSTSDKKVANVSVDKKKKNVATITAKKKGKATITAKLSGKKYTCKVTVKNRVYKSEKIDFDPSWQYGECAKIVSGSAVKYTVTSNDAKGKTVCINAGHGTVGGDKVKVLCHPDGSPKLVTGSTAAGATEATAVSLGMTFLDGTPEWIGTLKAAMATKKVLLEAGYNVLMIRETDDVQLDNIARTLIANNKADCHIAIHYDANVNTRDAGVFFCSIPDNDVYKNMEPVKTWWQEHMKLGTSCVNGLVAAGMNRKGDGTLDMDLTQTSFSTVPSIDLEVGNEVSLLTDKRLNMIAKGIKLGLDDYYGFKKLDVYEDVDPSPSPSAAPTDEKGNMTYQSDVTEEMTKYTYWSKLQKNATKVLMNEAQIIEKNKKFVAEKETNMNDLRNTDMAYDAVKRQASLANSAKTEALERVGTRKTIVKAGQVLDKDAIEKWASDMKENVANADVKDITSKKYAICTKRAELWMVPDSDTVGFSETDPDDEMINSAINVNEPFIIDGYTADGKFFHGGTTNCDGWVEADHFAICDDKETWLRQWDTKADDTLVVTTSHITLEKSNMDPATSGVDLMLGTQLPLVPRSELPEQIAERGTWYNHVVYLPTRGTDGKLVRSYALISAHHNVSVGWLPLTKKNILKVAFSCLGDRYGWGGMIGAMDCSMYTRSIYRCFGLELPRNTNWQRAMPTYKLELGPLTDGEKRNAIGRLPAGTLLMFTGHITMYLGEVGGKQYVISDMGTVSEPESAIGKTVQAKKRYCVSINSLDVRRAAGTTWLTEMRTALIPWMDD